MRREGMLGGGWGWGGHEGQICHFPKIMKPTVSTWPDRLHDTSNVSVTKTNRLHPVPKTSAPNAQGLTQIQSHLTEHCDISAGEGGVRREVRGVPTGSQGVLGVVERGDGWQDAVLTHPQVHQWPTDLSQTPLSVTAAGRDFTTRVGIEGLEPYWWSVVQGQP